ncbi:hypothetical protein ACVWZK_005353 [Bradyrhizobium sp. GM0.4]
MVANDQGGEHQGGVSAVSPGLGASVSRLGLIGAGQGHPQTFKQSGRGERLRQKADSARFQRAVAHGIVGKSRHENEGRVVTKAAHVRQELKAAHQRHLHIRDHAGRRLQFGRLKKFVSGAKYVDRVSPRRQQIIGRKAD